jgi:hypothetical protein
MARIARMFSAGALGVALIAAVPAWGQVPPFAAFKRFVPATILSGNPTKLTIRLQNINPTLTVSAISFADSFPAGMVLVPGVDPAFQCGGNLAFAANAFTFANGAVGPSSFCELTVTVTANSAVDLKLTNVTSAISYSFGAGFQTIGPVNGGLAVTGGIPPAITSAPPPDGQLGVPYDHAVSVTGTAPVNVFAAGLPPGLAFSPATLHITGTPATLGSYSGRISADNGFLPDALQNFTIGIGPPALTIVAPPSSDLGTFVAGQAIEFVFDAVGGVPPYSWAHVGGTLPLGTGIVPPGILFGRAAGAGTFVFDIQVIDAIGAKAVRRYTLVEEKYPSTLQVTISPNPAVSGQTLTVSAAPTHLLSFPTGQIDVWLAASAERCPAPFETGPLPETEVKRSATLAGPLPEAQFTFPNLRIDDYRVCAAYSGDANHTAATAGPLDAFVIKGALLAPPLVALAAPARVTGNAAIPAQVIVTPVGTTLMPGGSVRVLADGQPGASALLAGGVAWVVLMAPAEGTVSLSAEYLGDGTFPPAVSPLVLVSVAADGVAIPTLSEMALALLALALAALAAHRLRRRNR